MTYHVLKLKDSLICSVCDLHAVLGIHKIGYTSGEMRFCYSLRAYGEKVRNTNVLLKISRKSQTLTSHKTKTNILNLLYIHILITYKNYSNSIRYLRRFSFKFSFARL